MTRSRLIVTLSRSVVTLAKRYTRQQGISVSQMVEGYLSPVTKPAEPRPEAPALRSLQGSLKKADIRDYRKHLVNKHL
jgi:hypothetical protein